MQQLDLIAPKLLSLDLQVLTAHPGADICPCISRWVMAVLMSMLAWLQHLESLCMEGCGGSLMNAAAHRCIVCSCVDSAHGLDYMDWNTAAGFDRLPCKHTCKVHTACGCSLAKWRAGLLLRGASQAGAPGRSTGGDQHHQCQPGAASPRLPCLPPQVCWWALPWLHPVSTSLCSAKQQAERGRRLQLAGWQCWTSTCWPQRLLMSIQHICKSQASQAAFYSPPNSPGQQQHAIVNSDSIVASAGWAAAT